MSHLTALPAVECRALLGERGTGRAAYAEHGVPAVATLNYAVVGEHLYFRTRAGTVLARAVDDAVVAFNVDHVDADRRGGWSVTATGRCRRVGHPEPASLAGRLDTWAPGLREELFRLDLARLTGRRLGPPPERDRVVDLTQDVTGGRAQDRAHDAARGVAR
ncbi:pyridoxamine 5'-phosphate oxidase family protein [Kineococcus auxinigenes]|uniref:pyridoxamine 5'-phosphate oxidase family protein n=1 Tax=unclassified Kineococcus TaxID=2621656 RepID=UPI003D7ECE09